MHMPGRATTLALALGLLAIAWPAEATADADKSALHNAAQARLDKIASSVHAAKAPVAAPATPELHKSAQSEPADMDDADEAEKHKVIPTSHLTMDGSQQSGVLRAMGAGLGLNAMAEASEKDKKAKPLNQALTSFVKAKNPKTAWSHAIILVSIIGGSVVSLTAVGTYFIASAEAKRLKKAKKKSNLLAGRYGSVKDDPDSDDEPPPVYEPMQMTDIV